MKAQILKIAGVKSEKAFYKKYPTEAAFFKAHPEAKSIKKAQSGMQTDSNRNGIPDYLEMNPSMGQNQFVSGNGNIDSFYQYNQPAQYPGTMFKGSQIPQNDYVNIGKPPVDMSDPQAPSFQNMNMPLNQNIGFMQQVTDAPTNNSSNSKKGQGFNMPGFGNVFTGTVEGLKALRAEKDLTKKLTTWADVSDVTKKAAISNAFVEKPKNQWFRADDKRFIHNANELSNTQGRGTDILSSQNGSMIGGNPTEIQNTYDDGITLYDNLEYEPFHDSENDNEIKRYAGGGGFGSWWGQANAGLSGNDKTSFMDNVGQGSPVDSFVAGQFGNNAGSKIGGSLGSLFGPLGSLAGTAIGGYFDKEQGKQGFQKGRMAENNSFIQNLDITNGITGGLNSMGVAENGGYMNPEYNPQVITMFGDHNAKDFADYAHKYRAGGHLKEYTPPSARAMETYENGGEMSSYAMGGQLKTHWGGNIETIARNPYLPGSGEIAMLRGASHDNGGIGISYGGSEDGYGEMAANGANMGAQIEAETKEPIVEMANGGSVDPNTGKPFTEAVVFGNIPFTKKLAQATGDADLIKLADKHDGSTYKKIIADFAAPQNKAAKTKIKASEIANDADSTKWGKLAVSTAEAMKKGADDTQLQFANYIKKMADLQNATQEVKKEKSYAMGKNISAEALGKGNIETDYDPITRDAEIENPYAKSGAFLRKAQTGETTSEGTPRITEDVYNKLVQLYNQGKKDKKSPAIKEFQHLYHQYFPKEAVSAIQKTTKDKGVTNKAKQMGLTKEDILAGKDVSKILESNEDEFFGPRTEQYMAEINADFNKSNKSKDLQLTSLGTAATPTKTTEKNKFDVVPYKRNKLVDTTNIIGSVFNKKKFPGEFDPRQLAGEYTSIAQNQYEPVPSQQYSVELDPLYRVSYQDVRDQNTADFRDAERQIGYNPAAMAGLLGKKYLANNAVNAEEFRTNQAIEDRIYGGNRSKVNQEHLANIQLNADQMDKQLRAKTATQEKQLATISSIADKYLQFDTTKNKYLAQSNLFPQYGFDSSYGIHNQGPWYQPNIPQVYGGESTIEEVPVYGADGKLQYYKMQETGKSKRESIAEPGIVPAKSGGKITKNNRNSSIVKAYKNL